MKAQSKTVWKGKVIFILLIFLRKLTLLTCTVSTKTSKWLGKVTCAQHGGWETPAHCLLTVSLAPLDWWWRTGLGSWLLLHHDLLSQHLFHFTLCTLSIRELANAFASFFWVSCGCSPPSCWNNMKRYGTCNAGGLVGLLLLWVQAFCSWAICLAVLGKYPFGHQFVNLPLLLPFTFPYRSPNSAFGSCERCKEIISFSSIYLLKTLEIWGCQKDKILKSHFGQWILAYCNM